MQKMKPLPLLAKGLIKQERAGIYYLAKKLWWEEFCMMDILLLLVSQYFKAITLHSGYVQKHLF